MEGYLSTVTVLGMLLLLLSSSALLFAFLAWSRSRKVPIFLEELKLQLDGRLTQLLAKTDEAGKLIGRAAERADQLIRDQTEKDQSDITRRTYTTDQADRIVTEQENIEQRSHPAP